MKKGILRIILGLVLIALQIMSIIGNSISDTISYQMPSSTGQLLYDLISQLSYYSVGIIGLAILLSGICAFFDIHLFSKMKHDETTEHCPSTHFTTTTSPDRHKASSNLNLVLPIRKSTIILTAVIIALSVISSVMLYQNNKYKGELQHLYEQVSLLEEEKALAEEIATTRKRVNAELQRNISNANKTITKLQEENVELSKENLFFNQNIVFVPNDNTRIFHKYSCPKRTAKSMSFLAYNKEAAKSKGYKPCEECSLSYVELRMNALGID